MHTGTMARAGQIINLAGTEPIDDPEYRYKMPAVFGKIEGRGNGIKTVIPNISDVALSLHREPGEVNKFFGCELGAQTTYSAETDRAVVNGAHTDVVLQGLIKRYIDVFVLCPSCNLPETEYKIKNGCIYHKCAACGAKEMVDMSHKLCTYILAQDKKNKKDGKKDKGKKDKDKDKPDKDEKKSKKKSSRDKDKDKEGSDEEKKKKKKDKKKEKKDKKDKKAKKSSSMQDSGTLDGADEDDSEGGEDGSNEDVSHGDVDDAGAMDLAVDGTRRYLKENPKATPDEIAEVVVNQQMASALKSQDKVHIFARAVITPDFFKEKQVKKHAPTLQKLIQGNSIMERHLIAAMEGLCVDKPTNFPVLLKQLYDEDVLEEDVILEWACEGRNEYTLETVDEETRAALRGEAEPVVVWLQDEDSSDESDDE